MNLQSNPSGRPIPIIWGGALIVALWLGMTALGAILQENAPRAALMFVPANGFAYQGRAAPESLEGGALRDVRVSPAQLADAVAALRREPLAAGALTLVGMERTQRGDREAGARLVIAAHALDKRQLVANAWLINHYGTIPGHSREVLALLDEALRVQPGLAARYMPAFAVALANPDTLPVFQQLLSAKPIWDLQFWQAVSANPAALPNAQVLRSRLLRTGRASIDDTDTLLMDAFIAARRMDLALSYARGLPELPSDRDSLVRNGSFVVVPRMPPLDWELTNDGRISTAIDEGRGTLMVNATAGAGGTVARQLIALPPGEYSVLVKLGRAALRPGTELSVRIYCAENVDAIPAVSERVTSDLDRSFSIPDTTACRFFWADIGFSALDSAGPASTSVAEFRIVRGRARVNQQSLDVPAPAPTHGAGDPFENSSGD